MSKRRPPLPVKEAKRVRITGIARRLGLRHPKRKGRQLAVLCPLHDDHDPSCHLDTTRDLWYCPVCEVGGDGIRLVELALKKSFVEAVRWIVLGE